MLSCISELGANVPLSQFGQDTLERLSKGNLELLPMSSSENQPKQPIPNQPRQPIPNQPRQQIPSHPRQPILNQPRQPVFNQQRQPISNQPRQPIPIISKVIPVAPCHLESGNLKANQSNKISRNQSVSVADSQKLKVASSKNVTATSSQQLKETGSQKVMETGILNRLKEKIVQTQTGSIFAGGNGQKENLTSVATMAEKRRILCAKRSRFEDRLERLSQNFNSPPESESSAALKSATTSAINVKNRKETESPEKTFLKNATKFGAKLSSLIESRNSSPGGRGGCDEVSGSDTDMESESQSRHNKAKRVRASLSLSRKGTPQKSSPMKRPSEIKSEPEEDGYPGRRKKSKLCRY